MASASTNRFTRRNTTAPPSPVPVKSIGCLLNLNKMPITRFEMIGDREGFKRARARRQVLEKIAANANPDGTCSYVSDSYLTSRTGFVKRHCIRIRQELRDLGLLEWTEGRGFRGKQEGWGSNNYTVSMNENWQRRGKIGKASELNGDISKPNEGLNGDISKPNEGLNGDKDVTQPPFLPPKPLPPQRSRQNTSSAPAKNTETAERQSNGELKKLLRRTSTPANGRPTDPLRAELWEGIFGKRIEHVFYDSRRLPFKEQLHASVESAVTDLVNNRRGKMMHIRPEEIASSAVERLNGAQAVERIQDFGNRAKHCAIAVRNAVVSAAAELYEKQFARAKARSSGAA